MEPTNFGAQSTSAATQPFLQPAEGSRAERARRLRGINNSTDEIIETGDQHQPTNRPQKRGFWASLFCCFRSKKRNVADNFVDENDRFDMKREELLALIPDSQEKLPLLTMSNQRIKQVISSPIPADITLEGIYRRCAYAEVEVQSSLIRLNYHFAQYTKAQRAYQKAWWPKKKKHKQNMLDINERLTSTQEYLNYAYTFLEQSLAKRDVMLAEEKQRAQAAATALNEPQPPSAPAAPSVLPQVTQATVTVHPVPTETLPDDLSSAPVSLPTAAVPASTPSPSVSFSPLPAMTTAADSQAQAAGATAGISGTQTDVPVQDPIAEILHKAFPLVNIDNYLHLTAFQLSKKVVPLYELARIFQLEDEAKKSEADLPYASFVKLVNQRYKKISLLIHPDKVSGINPHYIASLTSLKEALLNQKTPSQYMLLDIVDESYEASGFDVDSIPVGPQDPKGVAGEYKNIRPDHASALHDLLGLFTNARVHRWSTRHANWFFAHKYVNVGYEEVKSGSFTSQIPVASLKYSKYYAYYENERVKKQDKYQGETILHTAYAAYCAAHGVDKLDFVLPNSNANLNMAKLMPYLCSKPKIGVARLEELLSVFNISDVKVFSLGSNDVNRAATKACLNAALAQCEGAPPIFGKTLELVMQKIIEHLS